MIENSRIKPNEPIQPHSIRVFDNGGITADRYTVTIGTSVYTMSENSNMPNGVNMYLGELGQDYTLTGISKGTRERGIYELPQPVLYSIIQRLQVHLELESVHR